MTKFILVGGYPHKGIGEGKEFYEELTAGFDEPVKILICLFARPRDTWEKNFEQDKEFLATCLPNKKLDVQLADPQKFVEQVEWANAVYIRGGTTSVLLDLLAQAPGWDQNLEGKTVAGSSAGAMALTTHDYNLDTLTLGDGLGLVPVKVLVHYRSDYNAPNIDWSKAEEELKNYKPELPLVTLKEGEFKVFEK